MKPKTYGSLGGLEVTVQTYDSYQEADIAAGKEGTVLESANDNFHYRGGPAQDTREFICDMLETLGKTYPKDAEFEQTDGSKKQVKAGDPIERFTKDTGKKDDKNNPILAYNESEGDFARRFCAVMGWDDLKQFQSQVDEWSKTAGPEGTPLAVDAKAKERKPRLPTKLADKYKKTAAMIITNGTLDRVNSNQLAKIGKSFTPSNDTSKMYSGEVVVKEGQPPVTYNVSDKDAEALGRLVKEYQDWKADQERADFLG